MIMQAIYTEKRMKKIFNERGGYLKRKKGGSLSPFLTRLLEFEYEKVLIAIYSDILRITIDSGNRSLCDFANLIKESDKQEYLIKLLNLDIIGLSNIDELIERMEKVKNIATNRNTKLVEKQDFKLPEGSVFKNAKSKTLELALNNGLICRELTGVHANSDRTPFDADFWKVLKIDGLSFEEIISKSDSRYGDLIFAIINRGQFQETKIGDNPEYDKERYESFFTGFHKENHYGIRTGLPSTEIDFIIDTKTKERSEFEREEMYRLIAKQGFYIPILDIEGKLVFSKKMYKRIIKNKKILEII